MMNEAALALVLRGGYEVTVVWFVLSVVERSRSCFMGVGAGFLVFGGCKEDSF